MLKHIISAVLMNETKHLYWTRILLTEMSTNIELYRYANFTFEIG